MLAIAGLGYLSVAQGMTIFVAATLYGFGKTFFWPTMLGVVSEQCPKGGALTLNAISGIGMLAVGTLGFTYIGVLQTKTHQQAIVDHPSLSKDVPGLVADGEVTVLEDKKIYEVLTYKAINDDAMKALVKNVPADEQLAVEKELKKVQADSSQGALYYMAFFPLFMLVCYVGMIAYFKSKGGYHAEVLTGHGAEDAKFTGGVEASVEG